MARPGFLQERWYEDRPPPLWTLPVSALFGAVGAAHRTLYRTKVLKPTRLPAPVIVVGNITVGGTGKTPLTMALVEALRARGRNPGVVSRGYGGMASSPQLLAPDPDPAQVGDEPALIRLHTGVRVAVGSDRPAAARLLLDQGVDVIVADDGLQHYALARDVEICVVDGVRRLGNGRLLPAGPLREPHTRLHDVDFIVCNGGEPQIGEIPMRLESHEAIALADPSCRKSLAAFAGTRVHAVAGIGNPQRFFDALRERGINVVAHPFPDHHRYAQNDLAFNDDLAILMTEKDGVKCRGFSGANVWAVPVSAKMPDGFFDEVVKKLPRQN